MVCRMNLTIAFYELPMVKFILQTYSFVILLLLFSLSAFPSTKLLQDSFKVAMFASVVSRIPHLQRHHECRLTPFVFLQSDRIFFIVSLIWMSALAMDEIRQARLSTLSAWWSSSWNRSEEKPKYKFVLEAELIHFPDGTL